MPERASGQIWTLAAALTLGPELRRWQGLGVRPRLWWRDDDARAPTARLDQLLRVAAGRPLALAVIPDGDLAGLAHRLADEPNLCVGQHGVDHLNQRGEGATPSEYPTQPSIAAIAERIEHGRSRLARSGMTPSFYTPPWNAVDAGLDAALVQLDFPLLSAGRGAVSNPALPYWSAEIDVLRWKGAPRFKGALRILSALSEALVTRRTKGSFADPVGLLTHHLDHDAATWRFLDWLLPFLDRNGDWTAAGPAVGSPRHAADPQDVAPMAERSFV